MQEKSESKNICKYRYFSEKLSNCLELKGLKASPIALATALNSHYKTIVAKPHTVRKWLIGETQPRSEKLLLLANWLNVNPKDLISESMKDSDASNKVSFEFDFTDQEVISKYLSMTVKQKVTVRLLIDAIADKDR